MKIFIVSALAATLCVAPAMAQTEVAPQPMAARPADVAGQIKQDLQELVAILDKPDSSFAALPYIYGAREGYFGSNEWVRYFKSWHADEFQLKDVKVLKREGNDATAIVSYAFAVMPADEATKTRMQNQQEKLNFKLVPLPLEPSRQVWQIVPPEVEPPKINAENYDVLWANASYHLAQKQLPLQTSPLINRSISHLKQLSLASFQLAMDYNEIFAFAPRYTVEALTPYLENPDVFRVPDTNEIYTFNANMSGQPWQQQALNADKLVLFYEGQNEKPTFRYDGKAAIGFADGHAALVTPDEAKSLIWKP